MKKITKKLALNKETISTLDKTEMMSLKGGITYSLSTGARCQKSAAVGGNGPTCKCGR
jgi:hypothetical protein